MGVGIPFTHICQDTGELNAGSVFMDLRAGIIGIGHNGLR